MLTLGMWVLGLLCCMVCAAQRGRCSAGSAVELHPVFGVPAAAAKFVSRPQLIWIALLTCNYQVGHAFYAALALLQLHWHPTMDEWQYLINGTITAGTFDGPGQVSGPSTLHAGDLGYAPRGSAHWLHNEGEGTFYHLCRSWTRLNVELFYHLCRSWTCLNVQA